MKINQNKYFTFKENDTYATQIAFLLFSSAALSVFWLILYPCILVYSAFKLLFTMIEKAENIQKEKRNKQSEYQKLYEKAREEVENEM